MLTILLAGRISLIKLGMFLEVRHGCYPRLPNPPIIFFSSTPQINTWTADWIEFYSKHRLGYQLELASRRYGDSAIYEKGTVGKVDLSQYLSFLSGLPNCSSVSNYHFSPV